MVHRPPDTRLLANLIDHEKEYAKHLAALFPLSNAALASLSAYAAASPSSANPIAAVVDVLASTDDALHRYTLAIDTWRQQLIALKDLEDDLAAVLRDRDILVTRLIKASKSTRDTHRSSRLVAPLTNLGSASLSSLPSTNSTAGSSPASTNSKLAQAQAELQACEAHLAAKERELDARRISVARDGLGARCRALIDCGWVWSEMGKQGLKALQTLNPDERETSHPAPTSSLAVPPRLVGTTTYASDNSSLTPSQSASQTAARSVETSHEGQTSKEHERVQPEAEPEATSKSQARSSRINDDGDLTITLPPAHAISELAFPTSVRTHSRPLENGDPSPAANVSTNTTSTTTEPEPTLRRKHTKRARRPPSQHIVEVSDEGSDERFSPSNRSSNVVASPRVPHAPLPATPAHDTSSDDEHPVGPLQVVENDPFEVIRRSMLGSGSGSPLFAPTTAPAARASAPDVRTSIVDTSSPSKAPFPGSSVPVSVSELAHGTGVAVGGPTPGSGPARRQRKTSIALFGSLRGLFRKPKERDRLDAEWNEGHASPSSSRTRVRGSGWVTRTDKRIRSRGGQNDSDEAVESTTTTPRASGAGATTVTANVVRATSGARLRKGRPSASSARENGPSHRAGVDGWITDGPGGQGAGTGADASGARTSAGRSRTRRGTVKRQKTSVADLRGGEQGHTDGEVDGERRSPERLELSKEKVEKAPEAETPASQPKPVVGQEKQLAAPTDADPAVDPNPSANLNENAHPDSGSPQGRATTTRATRKPSSDVAAPPHRRSASLSVVDAHVSRSTSTLTGGSMSWRKPPPQIESQPASLLSGSSQSSSPTPARAPVQPPTPTHETQPKQNAKRHLGNGHAKHIQNQSLMSIIADVTRQNQGRSEDRERVARSLDIPRAPGSVLSTAGEADGADKEANGRGHARSGSIPEPGPRAIKLPLRSALRNASRTPSPGPANVPVIETKQKALEEDRGRSVSPPWRDSASISSYETGRESLGGERPSAPSSPVETRPLPALPGQPRSQSQPPAARQSQTPSPPPFTFPPPPVDPPPARGTNAHEGSGPPSSRTSTETPPVRRKSVRVSLQPTFSPAPPASYDAHVDGYYTSWNRKGDRGTGSSRPSADVWADSSEEDEAYSRARRLLNLVGRGKA